MNKSDVVLKYLCENVSFDSRDIESDTLNNEFYRVVLFTSENMQIAVMSMKPGTHTGAEIHDKIDQFIRFESGEGQMLINNEIVSVKGGSSVIITKGTKHDIRNTSSTKPLKLYTIYSPPEYPENTLHRTKKDENESDKGSLL